MLLTPDDIYLQYLVGFIAGSLAVWLFSLRKGEFPSNWVVLVSTASMFLPLSLAVYDLKAVAEAGIWQPWFMVVMLEVDVYFMAVSFKSTILND